MNEQIRKAQAFKQMHDRSEILVLPNAWDAASARLFARLPFRAIATTSGGLAWSLGYADGERAPLGEVLAATARIARAVDLPVTADLESGYGSSAGDVAETVRAAIQSGIVGANLEDGLHRPGALRTLDDAVARIAAAREAAGRLGVPLVLNARVDTYMVKFGASDAERFDETLRRARAYLAAGADCVYPIGLADTAVLEALVKALDAPINVAARPGLAAVAELQRIGIARVSTATRLALLAYAAADEAARELHASGRFDRLDASLTHPQMQQLFG
ncbi:MAG: isocitrate lyase/phosphoenolpyruvate mutase family protein [Burkholderiales bacterium]|nr:isocitrate lyase/phosphoenolpyruvate mutase family protein [Burkholderiales bacterium]